MKAIGNTPLIRLERLPESGCAEIFVKYEGANPTGSMKDRMAFSMIEGAELDIIPSENRLITAKLEGIFGGTTSGANVWAALQRAKIIRSGKRIVTIICDTGLKYLDGDLYR